EDAFSGVVDLLERKAYTGEKGTAADVPADMTSPIDAARDQLIEAACEADDDVMAKYLEGEELSPDELTSAVKKGIASGALYPVFVGSSTKNIGISKFLDALVSYCPAPSDMASRVATNAAGEQEVSGDPSGPLAAFVFKTSADPFVGRLTYLRVVSGELKGDSHAWNANHKADERIAGLFVLKGKAQDHVTALTAGDIGAVAKLA